MHRRRCGVPELQRVFTAAPADQDLLQVNQPQAKLEKEYPELCCPTTTTILITGAMTISPATLADDEFTVSLGITVPGAPLSLRGVDPVAFLISGNQVEDAVVHTVIHDGVADYFASAASKTEFEADPTAHLPQNGGFFTSGASVRKSLAAIIDQKLYFFLREEIFNAFD